MKVNFSIIRLVCLHVALMLSLLSFSGVVFGQTSTWDGNAWQPSGVAPSGSTGTYTFYVDAGTNCSIGDASMSALYIRNSGTRCTITGTVTSNTVIIQYGSTKPKLSTNGTLNVTNLTVGGTLNGSGTINLSAGTYAQTSDGGAHRGNIVTTGNFNILSGTITFPYPFAINIQNMTIASGANVTIDNYSYNIGPSINGTLTIDGTLTNNYSYYDEIAERNIYFTISNLVINSSGSYNSSAGYSEILQSFIIGGTLIPAGSVDSYYYGLDISGSSKELDIFGSANLKLSDISYSDAAYKYLGTLNVYGGGKFTVDKSLTVNTVTINTQGSIISSGSPTITATTIDPIDGRLILPGATLNNSQTSLTINGTNSAIAYLNKPAMLVTLTGVTDTVRSCNLQRVTVNLGAKGYVSNNALSYKIQRIDASDLVTITSPLKNDTIQVAGTGSVVLSGGVRVSKLVDIALGGSLTSNGNLTMLDQSNLFFTTDGQITGNINWHRKYGSAGWVYFGSPFTGLNRTSILGSISSGYVNFNNYVESASTKRWVATSNSEIFLPGQGYELGITTITPANNDTVIFTGNPRRQDVTVNGLTYTTTNGTWFDYQRGYNLVANPYTAPISVAGFFTDNPNLNAIYYWDDIGKGKGVFVARSSTGLITPLASVSDKNKLKVQASYLAPNQGFFVKIPYDGSATSASFMESRITRDVNDNFLKSEVANYIRLQVENTSGTKNDCVIQFSMAATDTFTPNLDVYKLTSSTYPLEIYSFKKTEEFAIQSRKPVTDELHIPIGVVIKNNEKHTFHIDDFNALSLRINPYIWDKVAQRSVNLRDSAFTVTLSAGTIDDRFELVFKSGLFATGINSTNSPYLIKEAFVYSQDGRVYINFSQNAQDIIVEATDLSGRIVQHQFIPEAQGKVEVSGHYNPNNIYIFKISGKNIAKVNKLLIQ